jgi:hypothetical protein
MSSQPRFNLSTLEVVKGEGLRKKLMPVCNEQDMPTSSLFSGKK